MQWPLLSQGDNLFLYKLHPHRRLCQAKFLWPAQSPGWVGGPSCVNTALTWGKAAPPRVNPSFYRTNELALPVATKTDRSMHAMTSFVKRGQTVPTQVAPPPEDYARSPGQFFLWSAQSPLHTSCRLFKKMVLAKKKTNWKPPLSCNSARHLSLRPSSC